MDQYVIIVAGGKGQRMGMPLPKQFIDIAGRPVMMHTINAFYNFNNEIKIVVAELRPSALSEAKRLMSRVATLW